ncbi:hypothetical protein GCM10027051_02000 [Niabella terrae]
MKKKNKILILLLFSFSLTVLKAQQYPVDSSLIYTCPMHPEIRNMHPGNCPKCDMKLVADTKVTTTSSSSDTIDFERGHNDSYQPFTRFLLPVAQPTPGDSLIPVHRLSNLQKDIAAASVEAARAGIHFTAKTAGAKTLRYDLNISDSQVNYTGKQRRAIAVNGRLPAPTLVFTVGDTALIYVHNNTHHPTAVHWHGVQLPNRMDGVPYLTQEPIPAHTTYIYKFPVVQTGTYWYHSHFHLQEQIGLYGALIFNKRTEPDIPTIPVVLSDWSDLNPRTINRYLHNANDWFAVKKNAVQSYGQAIRKKALGTKLKNEWLRMHAMDISDVYYEKMLLNGKISSRIEQLKAGDRVRLRVVNGSSSTYFWLRYSGGPMTVIANDGNEVTAVSTDRLIIGVSETYDILVTLPENKTYEFQATAEDRSASSSLWLGQGPQVRAPALGPLQYFKGMKMMNDMMKMSGDMKPMGHGMSLQQMDMNAVMYPELDSGKSLQQQGHNHPSDMKSDQSKVIYSCPMHPEVQSTQAGRCPKCNMDLVRSHPTVTSNTPGSAIRTLNYNQLQATERTTLPEAHWRELKFTLEGNMNRYVWSLNNRTVSESDKIHIRQGENLRIILHNNSMMRHPMHLHGHDFRLLNQYGDRAPMKNVVDILPMETDTLEFHASESGDWFFHCHILYHMMSGMGRIFNYSDSPANPENPQAVKAYRLLKRDDRRFYFMAQNDFSTNGNDGQFSLSNTRWALQTEWRLGYQARHGYELETHFGRYLGKMQWAFPYIGLDLRYRNHGPAPSNIFGQRLTKDQRFVVHAGLQYTLPWLILADASLDHTGNFRLQFSREDIALTRRARARFMVNSDREFMVGTSYIVTRHLAPSLHYDSDMGWGLGLILRY